MGEQLKFRGQLVAHEDWVTSIAATSEVRRWPVESTHNRKTVVFGEGTTLRRGAPALQVVSLLAMQHTIFIRS